MSSVPSWAKIGAKVVCIGHKTPDHLFDWRGITDRPQHGTVYTIRTIENRSALSIGLAEIVNPPIFTANGIVEERLWFLRCFRPLHTLRSDIRMVKALVREMPASERLDRVLELLNEPETP